MRLLTDLISELERLQRAFEEKALEFNEVLKMGRTHIQDAVPVRLGQEFKAYSLVVSRDIIKLKAAYQCLCSVNLGGTAIGTGLNAAREYFVNVVPILAEISNLPLRQADDLIDSTQNLDCFVSVSSSLRNCAVDLSKIANDLRLMSSGPRCGFHEINLPAKQSGSSIMPGKVNPVIPEVINQVAFNIVGNDVTIAMAVEAGQLELNAFEPVIFYNLFSSIREFTGAVSTFIDNCVTGITANVEHCRDMAENSVGIITPLVAHFGYERAELLAKRVISSGKSVRALLMEDGFFTSEQIDRMLDSYAMTERE